MNTIYTPQSISVSEVYHLYDVPIPEGYEAYAFRPPIVGELYVSAIRGQNTLSVAPKDFTAPRIILKKKESPVKIVRAVRVLEYVGPEGWIEDTMKRNFVKGLCTIGSDRTIRELSTFKEELK